jgi:hypothetical protein
MNRTLLSRSPAELIAMAISIQEWRSGNGW